MDISRYGSHASEILFFLLDNGESPITTFSKLKISPTTYYRTLGNLEDAGLVKRREAIYRRKIVYVSLTEKGSKLAMQLKRAEEISDSASVATLPQDLSMTQEEAEMAKHLNLLFHVNVMDDHITVEEVKPGNPPRIFNIYVKRNGNGDFRLWCEHDDSYDCWHVKAAWTYPQVQKMMMHYKGRTKICPSCGFENPEAAKYCMECGARLK